MVALTGKWERRRPHRSCQLAPGACRIGSMSSVGARRRRLAAGRKLRLPRCMSVLAISRPSHQRRRMRIASTVSSSRACSAQAVPRSPSPS
jgi:hypothetical protein